MNQEIKKLWLEALRSGKYKQTTHCLHDHNGMCCLGVLCDVVKDRLGVDWQKTTTSKLKMFEDTRVLPYEVADLAEITGQPDARNPEVAGHQISKYNDGDAETGIQPRAFTKIADLIEKYL